VAGAVAEDGEIGEVEDEDVDEDDGPDFAIRPGLDVRVPAGDLAAGGRLRSVPGEVRVGAGGTGRAGFERAGRASSTDSDGK
jgi:hypothetical protein